MPRILDPKIRTPYILKEDRSSESAATFQLRPLTGWERETVQQSMQSEAQQNILKRLPKEAIAELQKSGDDAEQIILKYLDPAEMAGIVDLAKQRTAAIETVRRGVVSWESFMYFEKDGTPTTPIPLVKDGAGNLTDESLGHLLPWADELAAAINAIGSQSVDALGK